MNQAGQAFASYLMGKKTFSQAFLEDFVQNTIVVYGQVRKFGKARGVKYTKDGLAYHPSQGEYWTGLKYIKQQSKIFADKYGYKDGYTAEITHKRQPYYRDLRNALFFGNEKDIARAYWVAYNYIVSDLVGKRNNIRYSHKEAIKLLNDQMKRHSPIPRTMSNRTDGREKSIRNEFLDWLSPKDKKLIRKLESQYAYKLKRFNHIISLPKYKNQWSVLPYLGTSKGKMVAPNVYLTKKKGYRQFEE